MPESLQNHPLHDLFAEHTPQTVDVEVGWAQVQPRLMAMASTAHHTPLNLRMPRRAIAAAVVLALVLTSAGFLMGFAYSHACFNGGTLFLCSDIPQLDTGNFFQTINQQQTVQGVTMTITSVYADRGATLIAFTTQLSPELAAKYDSAYPIGLTVISTSGSYAGLPADGRGMLCDDPARDHGITACYARFGPFHPGTTAQTIDISVVVASMDLHRRAIDATIAGPWQFRFMMQFSQQNRHIIDVPSNNGPNQVVQTTPSS
jgi:hypothetical protein